MVSEFRRNPQGRAQTVFKGVGNQPQKRELLAKWGQDLGKELADLEMVPMDRLVAIAERVGTFLATGTDGDQRIGQGREDRLKTNQIRRFLDAVRRIEASLRVKPFEEAANGIALLRPKLAYAAGREEWVLPLMNVLDPAIRSAQTGQEQFKRLLRLIESILAYHKFHGGE